MIMIKNKQKTQQKLTPFERKKINVLQLLAKPKMFISSVDFFISSLIYVGNDLV